MNIFYGEGVAKGVVRMWRTSGQELASPFPDDASLAADKVSAAKLAPCKPIAPPWPRQKVERYLSRTDGENFPRHRFRRASIYG